MPRGKISKGERQTQLLSKLEEDPFVTDEELCEHFHVSIQTIRLDRLELGIPELRERVKKVAEKNYLKVKSLGEAEIIGELIDLHLNQSAISILETTKDLAFRKTKVVRGHHIFAMAESLAMAVIDADVAVTGVANMKYKTPVFAGEKLIAKAEVARIRGNKYFVHVMISIRQEQVFRGKFILVSIEEK
ncbi:Thioesterase superfamily protein [Geosporobacter subterraneus DSM 17957]|uniref:Thioesterase superfamily protein n=1 Tax=Geosporobacter subterraneus DSM 17957 TaxID=1121919 RepID=A0A1M6E7T5_9FIRM|nr:transcription factor FapR [Geosporobacter subterraneus]SHI81521.1 Thioesterase superfamily protein [Geosporobacter subterraneus DSM 17957]